MTPSAPPNSGAQGEYAGLLAIRHYREPQRGHRDICLILAPRTRHQPGFRAMAVCGRWSLPRMMQKAAASISPICVKRAVGGANLLHRGHLSVDHGVYEETIREVCEIVLQFGGQVYLDGANMNAQVGSPLRAYRRRRFAPQPA